MKTTMVSLEMNLARKYKKDKVLTHKFCYAYTSGTKIEKIEDLFLATHR